MLMIVQFGISLICGMAFAYNQIKSKEIKLTKVFNNCILTVYSNGKSTLNCFDIKHNKIYKASSYVQMIEYLIYLGYINALEYMLNTFEGEIDIHINNDIFIIEACAYDQIDIIEYLLMKFRQEGYELSSFTKEYMLDTSTTYGHFNTADLLVGMLNKDYIDLREIIISS